MKIENLNRKQVQQLLSILEAEIECRASHSANALGEKCIAEKLNKRLAASHNSIIESFYIAARHNVVARCCDASLELTEKEVDRLIQLCSGAVESLRDDIEDSVVAINANDSDESIDGIIGNLEAATKSSQEVKLLEKTLVELERQKELQAVGAKQQLIDELKEAVVNRDKKIDGLRCELRSAERHIYDLRHEMSCRGMGRMNHYPAHVRYGL